MSTDVEGCRCNLVGAKEEMCYLDGGRGFRVSSELCLDGLDLLHEEVAVQTEFRHLCLQTVRTCR